MGTFAGGIAHDFNNILGAIVGYGELALQALADETPQQRYVAQVLKSADRARSLVERILTFSRSGLTTRQPVHVQPVVHDAIEAMKVRLPAGIRLEVELNAPEARIEGDPAHIDQLVMNLCANAVHAMPAGGTLRVVLDTLGLGAARSLSHVSVEAGHFVRLAVSDSGVGMAPDLLERIFNPFFTTRKALRCFASVARAGAIVTPVTCTLPVRRLTAGPDTAKGVRVRDAAARHVDYDRGLLHQQLRM